MCVIVASILWVYVMNEQNPITTRSFTVPLQTVHLQDDTLVKDSHSGCNSLYRF